VAAGAGTETDAGTAAGFVGSGEDGGLRGGSPRYAHAGG
jgi:hypothetical protein